MEETAAAIKPTLHVVIESLLAWPFLLFVLLVVVLYRARGEIGEIIRSRQVDVALFGNSLSIGDAVKELGMESEQAVEDFRRHEEEIASLKRELAALKEGTAGVPGSAAPEPDAELPSGETPPEVGRNRRPGSFAAMRRAIAGSRHRWRTLERLAIEARISEDEALAILQDHGDEIFIGKSRAGKILARLKEPGDG